METIYLVCAIVGGTVLVCQLLLSFLGLGEHHDVGFHEAHDLAGHGVEHEGDHNWLAGVLTFRTVIAALTFFGLAGLAASQHGMEPPLAAAVALAAGGMAVFLVAWLMQTLLRLRADGTVRIDRAVGKSGTVYLTVPGQRAGVGKVTFTLQNRTVEYQAVTANDELPTGTKIVIVSVISPDTVEVALLQGAERTLHV